MNAYRFDERMETGSQLTLDEREAAEWLGISVSSLSRLRKRGRIRFVRLGRRVVYPVSVIRAVAEGTDTGITGGAA